MRGGIDEGKELSPMFPRLHVKDADKGGPKAPPRNKMALYEQLSIPSRSFASGSASLFPLPLRNCTVPTSSSHVDSSQRIQLFTFNASSIRDEKIQAYNSRKINSTKLTQDDSINSKNSPKTLDVEDAFLTSGSALEKNSRCSIIQKDKDEDKLAHSNLRCSDRSLSSINKANSLTAIELKAAKYRKNQLQGEHTKVKEGHPHPLDGLDDMTDASLISLVKGSRVHTHEEHATFGNKINLRDHHIEKPAVSDVHKSSCELEIGRRFCFQGKEDENEEECTLGMDISPDNVVGVIGEKQFWKARRIIINQQRLFIIQVFELHRLITVQRLIAGSPHILLEGNVTPNKPPPKTSTPKKLQSEFVSEQPFSVVKLDNKSKKASTIEHAKNNAIGKIPIPFVNNVSKGHEHQLSNYGHHFGNFAIASPNINSTQSPSYVYPPPGNQWLVPVMSPSEGLVYKPIIGPCPPNAGFMAPIYGTMSFNPGSKDVSDAPSSHQNFGILSSPSLPQFLPPQFMHPSSVSTSVVEHIGQSNGPENHHSCGEVSSAILYQRQGSSNMSSQTSQVMSRNISTHQSLKDKELQRSTASSPSKRVKGNVLPLFPLAPTFWPSGDSKTQVEQQPKVIKAMPHNPKSTSESAARIFRSIQEERKHL
ncbi:ELF3-like protein 2 isoform X2 [Abrus precatorius]|uniref:ELF3-like protein 2 isoform X2 n=1 Tax=Abrus precatorius TaxID=3816 RepID=A0A8B8JY57_ABRPR|nr:ELF3-like protein 2 isoform X2 [Abrus precatorius]